KCSAVFSLLFLSALVAHSPVSAHRPIDYNQPKRLYSEAELETLTPPGPNPFISYLPVEAEVDWWYWIAKMKYEARIKAQAEAAVPGRGVPIVNEVEPNDGLDQLQNLDTFGTGDGLVSEIVISGTLGQPTTAFTIDPEDNGAIPLATLLTIAPGQVLTADGAIGDGPHGSGGTGNADFDFFEIQNVVAGETLSIEVLTDNPSGDLDPNTAIWDASGNLLGFNEDIGGGNFDSRLTITAPSNGDYFLSIGGWKSGGQAAVLPGDPFNSGSGTGTASEGNYTVLIGLDSGGGDIDCFGLNLVPGDLFGAGGVDAAELLEVFTDNGELQMGSDQSFTSIYPAANPLPSGNASLDFVAYNDEEHGLCVQGAGGDYEVRIAAFRQIFEGTDNKQTLFIDFDGATINPSIFNGPNEDRDLSPLADFLAGWGLTPADEDALIDAIMVSIEESITQDLALQNNANFDVEILNSRDHADPFGQPNVSRVIVGGTIAESGISTIGIAQSIDPGNFEAGETGLTLLDLLSAPANNPNSLNRFNVDPSATQIELVAVGVGNITVHEAGHFLGNWHTENSTAGAGPAIMDRGGNLPGTVGVGPDNIFGTADDIDVDFIPDLFSFAEGFSGTEHTNQNTAFALTSGSDDIFADSFETPQ
ncbi:MAG: hypothetical protein AAGH65_07220, partial [Pseudomonadota bacterium]